MTTIATASDGLSPTVERFLDAIRSGAGLPGTLLGAEAVLDASVPGWHAAHHCGGRWDAARLAEIAAAQHAW
jgi:hypothetical protein